MSFLPRRWRHAPSALSTPPTRRRRRRAQALVEFAIVLPALITLGFNMLTIATVYRNFGQVYQAIAVGGRVVGQKGGDDPLVHTVISSQLAAVGLTNVTYCSASCTPSVPGAVTVQIPAGPVAYGTEIVITAKYLYTLNLFYVYNLTRTGTSEYHVVSEQY